MRAGDKVVSRNEATGKASVKKVLYTTKRTVDVVLDVTLADKAGKVIETITTTRNHPFYVSGKGFVPAGGLAVGNAIVTRAGPDAVVSKIEWKRRAEGFAVYNFEVEDDHTYFVGNSSIWVHNPAPCNWQGFSKGELSEHYQKHVVELGEFPEGFTQNQYLAAAKSFGTEEGAFMEAIEGNFFIRYDPATRRTLVGHIRDRRIRTFYIADYRSPDPFQDAINYARDLIR